MERFCFGKGQILGGVAITRAKPLVRSRSEFLSDSEDLHEHWGVAGEVWPDHVVAPEMHPGVAGTQSEIRLHHAGAAEEQHDKNYRECSMGGRIVARPVFGEVHGGVGEAAE